MLVEILKPHPAIDRNGSTIWDENPFVTITDTDNSKIIKYGVLLSILRDIFGKDNPHLLIIVYSSETAHTVSSDNNIHYKYTFEFYYKALDSDKCEFGSMTLNEENTLVSIVRNQTANPDMWFIRSNIAYINQISGIEKEPPKDITLEIEIDPRSLSVKSGTMKIKSKDLSFGKVEGTSLVINKEKQEEFMKNMGKKFASKSNNKN